MKFTIICHLATSLYIVTDKKGGQMTNNCNQNCMHSICIEFSAMAADYECFLVVL